MNHRWAGTATSATLHVLAGLAMLALARSGVSPGVPKVSRPLTFVSVLSPLEVPPAVLTPPLRLPPLAETVERSPLPEPPPRLEAPPERVVVRGDPPPEPRRDPPPPIETSKRPVAVVTVGTFAASAAPARNADLARPVQSAGFDAPEARAPELKVGASASVGVFERSPGAAQLGTDRPNRTVTDSGFGSLSGPAPAAQPARQVRVTDFDARPAAPPAPPQPRPSRVDVPLEIVSKPTPAYTDEARALKIEGEVLLDVEFAASGDVRVLHVVRGLGHGLDEAASRAAAGMRFKPAQSGGRAVDFRATVHIVFRLA